jgi:acyl-CoA thioester hydrolase
MPRIFEKPITVTADHTDELGHVNNLVYLEWFLEASTAHSTARGWPPEAYLKKAAAWVVRKHEIEYFAPSFPGDELVLKTWVATMNAGSSLRRYELIRRKDSKKIATGSTLFVWMDLASGRPLRVPADIASSFEVISEPS